MSDTNKEGYLTGKLLLAMPSMTDPRFHRSVIYMCNHDASGAMGLVVNHMVKDLGFADILKELPLKSEITIDPASLSIPVMVGGPVDSGRGFLLHSSDFHEQQTINVDDDFSVTATLDIIRAIAKGEGPDEKLFILGYAGWTAGQLEEELQHNAWLVTDADPELIFDVSHEEKWAQAVGKLGFDPAMLSGDAGRA